MSQSFSPPMPKTVGSARLVARWPLYTMPKALISAAIGLAGFLACNYLVVARARARVHAR
jgi:hypothetical protein